MLVPFLASTALVVKKNFIGLSGTVTSWIAVITGDKLQHLESWLRNASYAGALLVSAVTIWSLIRKDRRESAAK